MIIAWGMLFEPIKDDTGRFLLHIILATLLFVAVMVMLHRLSPLVRKWLTIGLTFVAGLYFLLEYLLPTHPNAKGEMENFITPTVQPVNEFIQYIFVWAIGLGLISLMIVHGRKLWMRTEGWHNSLAFFLATIAIIVFGFTTQMGASGTPGARFTYDALFAGLLTPLDSTMFALLAFYIASAAYRAFRVRTVEAGLLMFSAMVVMLGFINIGVLLTQWIPTDSGWAYLRIERFSLWILNWVNMPGQRAVGIGVSIGMLAMAMRLWLSLERGSFFKQES